MKLLRYHPPIPNFGDDLNSVLWPDVAPSLFARAPDDVTDAETAFVGIGTIVGIDPGQSRRLHVFSSGAGYTTIDRWANCEVEYHCVRGPITAKVLNLDSYKVLSDGALLAPALHRYQSLDRRSGCGTIVIPHFETLAFDGWHKAVDDAGFSLVDPRNTPDVVITKIATANLVLTESLHGAILADAFGIPWIAFAVSGNFSLAKWTDWASSLGLQAEVMAVPPPDALHLLHHGRPRPAFGHTMRLDPEAAMGEFQARINPDAHQPFLKAQAKRVMQAVPAARRILGFSVERTAEALSQLAQQSPYLSNVAKREELTDAMLNRLDRLVARHAVSQSALV